MLSENVFITYFLHVTNVDDMSMTVIFLQSDNILTHCFESVWKSILSLSEQEISECNRYFGNQSLLQLHKEKTMYVHHAKVVEFSTHLVGCYFYREHPFSPDSIFQYCVLIQCVFCELDFCFSL